MPATGWVLWEEQANGNDGRLYLTLRRIGLSFSWCFIGEVMGWRLE